MLLILFFLPHVAVGRAQDHAEVLIRSHYENLENGDINAALAQIDPQLAKEGIQQAYESMGALVFKTHEVATVGRDGDYLIVRVTQQVRKESVVIAAAAISYFILRQSADGLWIVTSVALPGELS